MYQTADSIFKGRDARFDDKGVERFAANDSVSDDATPEALSTSSSEVSLLVDGFKQKITCEYYDAIKDFIKVMKALSDPNRVKMVKLLQRRVLCVCEIQEALGLAQSTASKHLKILEEAGLIAYFKEGSWVNYQLADGARNPYVANLLGNLRHWLEDDADVVALVARLPEIHRETICGI